MGKKVVEMTPQNDVDTEAARLSLTRHRVEMLKLYRQDLAAGQEAREESGEDLVDRANQAYNRELLFSLSDSERVGLIQIEEALRRLDSGAYGVCTHCSSAIGRARLDAVPWTPFCIECQEQAEEGLL